MSKKLTAISYEELEQSKDTSVWVYNNAKPKGRIHITVTGPNGKDQLVTIENSWIPQDLTTRAPRKSLVESPDLRKLWSSGKIKIVTSESVKPFMATAEAQAEARRIEKRAVDISTGDFEVTGSDKAGTAPASNDQPSLRVINMEGLDEDTNLSNLRTNADEMTRVDLEYLVRESKQAKVKALAAEMLEDLED